MSKITTGFTQEGLQAPKFEATMAGIMVTVTPPVTPPVAPPVTPEPTPRPTPKLIQIMGSEELIEKLLNTFKEKKECKFVDIKNGLGFKDEMHVRNAYLKPLLNAGILVLKYPDVPNHPKQMYLLVIPK